MQNFKRKLNLRHVALENKQIAQLSTTVVVHLLYTASEITSIYTEILVQYHSKATDTVCSIKLKREEFLYIRTIFNFQAECVLIYMLLFLPNFSLGVFNPHVLVCGLLLYCMEQNDIFRININIKLMRERVARRYLLIANLTTLLNDVAKTTEVF